MSDFLTDWDAATEAFHAAASPHGTISSYPFPGTSPAGTPFQIDVLEIGDAQAERCVIVTAGLHGVEGVMGSAIQRYWLESARLGVGVRVVLAHVLNPYGFAFGRRVDQDNVDLNRNFLDGDSSYAGAPDGWQSIASWLSADRPSALRLPRALWMVLRFGTKRVLGAVAGGQYINPTGLFFGGSCASPTYAFVREHLPGWVGSANSVIHIDLHSGMGKHGALALLASPAEDSPEAKALKVTFGDEFKPRAKEVAFYRTTGSLGGWCCAQFPEIEYHFMAAEFGTVPVIRNLLALAEENWCSFNLPPDHVRTIKARAELLGVFNPESTDWRAEVLRRGKAVCDLAVSG